MHTNNISIKNINITFALANLSLKIISHETKLFGRARLHNTSMKPELFILSNLQNWCGMPVTWNHKKTI